MTNDQDLKAAEEQSANWASSQEAQAIANFYERSATTFLSQQRTFQAHIDGQNSGYKNGYLAGLAVGRKERGWISVKERLPEVGLSVLFTPGTASDAVVTLGCYRGDGKWQDYTDHTEPYGGVTHWMPLPDAPKEGK